jgi:predicted amidohydrolase
VEIAIMQVDSSESTPRESLMERVLAQLDTLAKDSQLVILPELWFHTAFGSDAYNQELIARTSKIVRQISRIAESRDCWIHSGSFIFKHSNENLYNRSYLINRKGEIAAEYDKNHLFGIDSGESKTLTAGNNLCVISTEYGKIGIATCFDLRFPELFRELVLLGAEVIIVVSAWPKKRIEDFKLLSRARALENQVILINCNGVGFQGNELLGGNSIVINPRGNLILEMGDYEDHHRITVDLKQVHDYRMEFPVLESRKSKVPHWAVNLK